LVLGTVPYFPYAYDTNGRVISIPPGEMVTRTFRIDRFYRFPAVGEYRIIAVRRIAAPGGWAYVVSNTVVLTVTPNP
jgi:hypothetical protein